MSNQVSVIESKTKSGNKVMVAVIPVETFTDQNPERIHWEAVKIAHSLSCTHYRVMRDGRVYASAKAGALPSQEATARRMGDGSDWSHD